MAVKHENQGIHLDVKTNMVKFITMPQIAFNSTYLIAQKEEALLKGRNNAFNSGYKVGAIKSLLKIALT